MFGTYLTRGVKAGLVAGLVFGLFMAVVANPLVAFADEQNHAASEVGEHGHEAGHGEEEHHEGGHGHHDAAVSTAFNKTVSVVASGVWAVTFGLVFGIVYYFLEPAIPGTGLTKSYVLGAAGFITVSGAPWLVLPPASPGAQQSMPTDTRILLYSGMMVAGAVACLLAGFVYNRASESNGTVLAAIAGVLPLGLLAIPAMLAPSNTVEGVLSPTLRSGLIGLIVFGQVLVWLLLAGTYAQLQSRADPEPEIPASGVDSSVTAD